MPSSDSDMIAEIKRVSPQSARLADAIHDRVVQIARLEEFGEFKSHLSSECFGFVGILGTMTSDPIAAYQAMMIGLLDIAGQLQIACRTLDGMPLKDGPAALAIGAYAASENALARSRTLTFQETAP